MKKHINMKVNDSNLQDGIETYITNKGVETPEAFLNGDTELNHYTEPSMFHHMEEAVNLVKQGVVDKKHFLVVIDQDMDGYASSAMIYRLLTNEGAFVELISSNKKVHGIETLRQQILMDYDSDIVIIPDGGINDYDAIRNLIGRDIDVIVLDHHLINKPDQVNDLGSYMVSAQNPENASTNTHFTGVGMVEKFIEMYLGHVDPIYQSLSAVGQVADISDTSDIEVREMVKRGLSNFNEHPFFKEFGLEDPVYQGNIGWSVSPLVNAVSRFGTLEERLQVVRALSATLEDTPTIPKNKKKKNKETGKFDTFEILVNEYTEVYSMMESVKRKQKKSVDETLKQISWLIEPEKNNVAVAVIPSDKNSAVTGLIANQLQSKYGQPVLVGRDINGKFWGSLRSPGQFPFTTWVNDTGFMNATGHEQAAGVNFATFYAGKLADKAKELDFNGHPTEVDLLFDGSVNKDLLDNINLHEDYWGGSVNKPVVGVKNLVVNKANINLKPSMITFLYNDVQFTMFKAEKVIKYLLHETGFATELSLDMVCEVSETSWGKKMPQLMVQDIGIDLKKPSSEEWVF